MLKHFKYTIIPLRRDQFQENVSSLSHCNFHFRDHFFPAEALTACVGQTSDERATRRVVNKRNGRLYIYKAFLPYVILCDSAELTTGKTTFYNTCTEMAFRGYEYAYATLNYFLN